MMNIGTGPGPGRVGSGGERGGAAAPWRGGHRCRGPFDSGQLTAGRPVRVDGRSQISYAFAYPLMPCIFRNGLGRTSQQRGPGAGGACGFTQTWP